MVVSIVTVLEVWCGSNVGRKGMVVEAVMVSEAEKHGRQITAAHVKIL